MNVENRTKIADFPTPVYLTSPMNGFPLELCIGRGSQETRMMGLSDVIIKISLLVKPEKFICEWRCVICLLWQLSCLRFLTQLFDFSVYWIDYLCGSTVVDLWTNLNDTERVAVTAWRADSWLSIWVEYMYPQFRTVTCGYSRHCDRLTGLLER